MKTHRWCCLSITITPLFLAGLQAFLLSLNTDLVAVIENDVNLICVENTIHFWFCFKLKRLPSNSVDQAARYICRAIGNGLLRQRTTSNIFISIKKGRFWRSDLFGISRLNLTTTREFDEPDCCRNRGGSPGNNFTPNRAIGNTSPSANSREVLERVCNRYTTN
jgi:hypothetical protein